MPKPAPSPSWQEIRRLLASKSKTELLNLIRDLYILTTDNKDFVHAQVLTPKPTTPKARQPKKPPSSTSKVIPKIRQLANIATELREGASFNITRLITLKSLCEEATAAARFAVHLAQLTYRKMQEKPCPSHLDPEKWEYYKQVVDEAIRQMHGTSSTRPRKPPISFRRGSQMFVPSKIRIATRRGDQYGLSTVPKSC
jgi:hypothetical protein